MEWPVGVRRQLGRGIGLTNSLTRDSDALLTGVVTRTHTTAPKPPAPLPPLDDQKITKFAAADAEFIRRGLVAHGKTPGPDGKVRGVMPDKALDAWNARRRNQPQADAVDALFNKLDTLKDTIEDAADQAALDAIDIEDNIHWS